MYDSDSSVRLLVPKYTVSSVSGSSPNPRWPVTYQPPTMVSPMTAPPRMWSALVLNSRSLKTKASSASANASGTATAATPGARPVVPATTLGRSWCARPCWARSTATTSIARVRHTAKSPFNVA